MLDLLLLSRREVSCYSDAILSEGFSEVSATEDRQLVVDVTESGDQGAWVAREALDIGPMRWVSSTSLLTHFLSPEK